MRLILASGSPRRRELLAQAGYAFEVVAANVDESLRPGEAAGDYVRRLAEEKARAVYEKFADPTLIDETDKDGAPRLLVAAPHESTNTPGLFVMAPHESTNPPGLFVRVPHESTNTPGLFVRAPHESTNTPGLFVRAPHESSGAPSLPASSARVGSTNVPLVVLGADTTVVCDGEFLAKPDDAADAKRMLRRLSGRTHEVLTGVAVVTRAGVDSDVETTLVTLIAIAEDELDLYCASAEPMDKAGAYGIQGYAARWIPRVEGCYFNVMGLPIARVVRMIATAISNVNKV